MVEKKRLCYSIFGNVLGNHIFSYFNIRDTSQLAGVANPKTNCVSVKHGYGSTKTRNIGYSPKLNGSAIKSRNVQNGLHDVTITPVGAVVMRWQSVCFQSRLLCFSHPSKRDCIDRELYFKPWISVIMLLSNTIQNQSRFTPGSLATHTLSMPSLCPVRNHCGSDGEILLQARIPQWSYASWNSNTIY